MPLAKIPTIKTSGSLVTTKERHLLLKLLRVKTPAPKHLRSSGVKRAPPGFEYVQTKEMKDAEYQISSLESRIEGARNYPVSLQESSAILDELQAHIAVRRQVIEGERVKQLNEAIHKEWLRSTSERLDLAIDTVRTLVLAGATATGKTTILVGRRLLYREALWATRRKHSRNEIPEICVINQNILKPFALLQSIFKGVLFKGETYLTGIKKYLSSMRHGFVMGDLGDISSETIRYSKPFR